MTLFRCSKGDILWVIDQSNKKTKQPVKQLATARLGKKKEGKKMATTSNGNYRRINYSASITATGKSIFFETHNIDAALIEVYYVKSIANFYAGTNTTPFRSIPLLLDTLHSTWSGSVDFSPYKGQNIIMRTEHIAYGDMQNEIYRNSSVVNVTAV